MSELWVERHRPQSVGEIRGQASVVSRLSVYAEHKEFPHLLFAGPPGTGKTTAAMALTKDVFGEHYRDNLLEHSRMAMPNSRSFFSMNPMHSQTMLKALCVESWNNTLRRVDSSSRATIHPKSSSPFNPVVQCFDFAHSLIMKFLTRSSMSQAKRM